MFQTAGKFDGWLIGLCDVTATLAPGACLESISTALFHVSTLFASSVQHSCGTDPWCVRKACTSADHTARIRFDDMVRIIEGEIVQGK
jgi:hypothetical protein